MINETVVPRLDVAEEDEGGCAALSKGYEEGRVMMRIQAVG